MRRSALPVVLAALVAAAPAAAQDRAALAQQRFVRGVEAFQARNYAAALDEFRASMAAYGSPNSRLYAARCLRELGQLADALAEFERAAAEAGERAASEPRYGATAQSARLEAAQLEPRVARLTVTAPGAPAALRLWIGAREVPAAALGIALPVLPGPVEVRAEAEGFAPARREVVLLAGQRGAVVLALRARPAVATVATVAPAPRGDGGDAVRPLAWTALGLAGGGLVAFGTLALLADQQFRALPTCDPECPDGNAAGVDRGRALQLATNVSLGVAIGGAAVSALLFVLAPRHAAPRRVAVQGRGLALRWEF